MKIPFDALTLIPNGGFTAPESGDVWKANLFRVDPNVWHGTEYLSWSSHDSFGFHQPSKFGDLVFEGGPLTGFDNMSEDYVQLYPNPSSGSVLFSKKVSSVEVFNVLGENVYSDENIENVDLSYLEKGVYVFSLFVEGRTIISKLVIK